MYVLKCVKPGYYHCNDHSLDLKARTGEFIAENSDMTRSINKAELFKLKWQATQVKEHYEVGQGKGNAAFEVSTVVVSLK